jgi:hypothetical protein
MKLRTLAFLALGMTPTALAAQQAPPSGWSWALDGPGIPVASEQAVGPSSFYFVSMAPGWHMAMGPGGLLYDPRYFAEQNWMLESEVFLSPGESQEGYGIFFGGSQLKDPARAYTAFVMRRDGFAALLEYRGGTTRPIRNWTRAPAVAVQRGSNPAQQLVRIAMDTAKVRFLANGTEVFSVARSELRLDGNFGFRLGKGINLHATRLDITNRLAPLPQRR